MARYSRKRQADESVTLREYLNPIGVRSLLAILVLAIGAAAQNAPVVVELFTSEGCSSCPPADALLMQLDRRSEIIALGEHVDYWDALGWKDRFSSRQFTDRQERYAGHFSLQGPYTPQLVINGHYEIVGNDVSGVSSLLDKAQKQHAAGPAISLQPGAKGALEVRISPTPRPQDVILAITESNLTTEVGRGENHGRTLRHTAVVRELRVLGRTSAKDFIASPQIALKPDWRPENLGAVVFLQDPSTLEISAAARSSLPR
ncbi:MAG: DUF1223 domain-containing protein [Terriglobales bacterium]